MSNQVSLPPTILFRGDKVINLLYAFAALLVGISVLINVINIYQISKRITRLEEGILSDAYDAHELPRELANELSIQEHVILRENDFDRRIALMREELKNDGLLHPDVKNLPHEIIDRKPVIPEEEVAN